MPTDWNDWFKHEHPPALKKEWTLNSTWTDCPVEVQEVIENIWEWQELGNDNYKYEASINDLIESQTSGETWRVWQDEPSEWIDVPINMQPLIDYLKAKGVADDENVIIMHWW